MSWVIGKLNTSKAILMEQPLLLLPVVILVMVASTEMRTLKTEVGTRSMFAEVGFGLAIATGFSCFLMFDHGRHLQPTTHWHWQHFKDLPDRPFKQIATNEQKRERAMCCDIAALVCLAKQLFMAALSSDDDTVLETQTYPLPSPLSAP